MNLEGARNDSKIKGSVSSRSNSICLCFGHVCSSSLIERTTRRTFAGQMVKGKRFRSARMSHQKIGRNIELENGQPHSFGCPRRARIRSTDPWVSMSNKWNQIYQKGFNHSRKDCQVDRQVRQTSLQLTWLFLRQEFLLPRILQQNLHRTEQEESLICSLIFQKTRLAKFVDAQN